MFKNWRHHKRPKNGSDAKIKAQSKFTGINSKTLPPITCMSQKRSQETNASHPNSPFTLIEKGVIWILRGIVYQNNGHWNEHHQSKGNKALFTNAIKVALVEIGTPQMIILLKNLFKKTFWLLSDSGSIFKH